MNTRIHQQVTALAAVVQAATLVEQVARSGDLPASDATPLLQALFIQSPEHFSDVYGDASQTLHSGLENLQVILGQTPRGLSPDVTRYALSLIHLESKLRRNPAMLQELGQGISQASRQASHFGATHENTLAAIADVYQRTLSHLKFRIHVTGQASILQNPQTANRIRALLLAGIRAAILWRQVGGHRWQLLIKRNACLKTSRELLNTPAGH